MTTEKEQLKEKLIEFQQTISQLKLNLVQTEELFLKKENDSFLTLLEIMDSFETLEQNIEAKKESLDKTARMLGKNIRSIHRKLSRHFQAASIVKMEFPKGKATMERCKIIETRKSSNLENETILEIIKNGYINEQDGTVLRKAEVITVSNSEN